MRAAAESGADARPKIQVKGGVKDLLVLLLLALVLGSVIFTTVWRRVTVLEIGYSIRALEGSRDELMRQQGKMEIEKAMLSSPDRIRRIAESELGMTEPVESQLRIIR